MAVLAHALFWLRRFAEPPVFVITFRDGRASLARGAVPGRCLADCAAIAADFDLTRGHVDGVRRGGRLRLRFSPSIPEASHQRFRNVLGQLP